jgi:hypothetical protein
LGRVPAEEVTFAGTALQFFFVNFHLQVECRLCRLSGLWSAFTKNQESWSSRVLSREPA